MRRKQFGWLMLIVGVTTALWVNELARGWWTIGHETITEAAAAGLPDEMPLFFRAGGKVLAGMVGDPDRWKNRTANFLKIAEAPNHFLDLEDLENNPLPKDRYAATQLLIKLGKDPATVGFLPYAILEGVDKLAVAFYDYRNDKKNPANEMKCLVYAGILAHYTTDAAMPLHTTRDYDGRTIDGMKRQKGIHAKIDGFPEKNGFTVEEVMRGLQARKIEDPWGYVLHFIQESHKHVSRCYDLDAEGAFDRATPESRAFIMERCRAGAQFTMDLWYHAWLRSATMPKHY